MENLTSTTALAPQEDACADSSIAAVTTMFPELPGAHFFNESAVEDCGHFAARYESVVLAYELTGDRDALWENLRGLCFDRDEIEWHSRHRGQRLEQGYA